MPIRYRVRLVCGEDLLEAMADSNRWRDQLSVREMITNPSFGLAVVERPVVDHHLREVALEGGVGHPPEEGRVTERRGRQRRVARRVHQHRR